MRRTLVKAVVIVLVAGTVVHAAKFKSTWKAPDAGPLDFAGKKVAAVVVMRVVSSDKEISYTPDLWMTPSYGSLWDYYGYGWSTVIVGGRAREDTILTIETLIFNVPKNKLIWAGVSEKTNPKDAQQVVKTLVDEVAKEMRKNGLVPRGTP